MIIITMMSPIIANTFIMTFMNFHVMKNIFYINNHLTTGSPLCNTFIQCNTVPDSNAVNLCNALAGVKIIHGAL